MAISNENSRCDRMENGTCTKRQREREKRKGIMLVNGEELGRVALKGSVGVISELGAIITVGQPVEPLLYKAIKCKMENYAAQNKIQKKMQTHLLYLSVGWLANSWA